MSEAYESPTEVSLSMQVAYHYPNVSMGCACQLLSNLMQYYLL